MQSVIILRPSRPLEISQKDNNMNALFKYSAIALAVTSLSACLEVEDNNDNDDVVAALQQQNDLLAEQNAKQQAESSITLTGKIYNLSTEENAQNASVKVKVGNEWSEPVLLNSDGSFELSLLPNNSDFSLLVTSNDGAFLERVFFGTTKAGNVGASFQDVGLLNVSQGKTYSFPVLDSATSESIKNLDIFASSRIYLSSRMGAVSDYKDYYHKATYNEQTHEYEIVLPKDDLPLVYAEFDIDKDGKEDYRTAAFHSSSGLLLRDEDIAKESPVYLIDITEQARDIEFRISVVDELGNTITGHSLFVDDQDITSTYDSETKQYVLSATLLSSLNIMSPSFTYNGNIYKSGYIEVDVDNDKIDVFIRVGSTNTSYSIPLDSEVVDLVISPSISAADSDLELVYKTPEGSNLVNQYQVYYSQAIALTPSSVSLIKKDELSIIRGNDSADDLILAGTTTLETNDVEVPMNTTLSLNNTLLTITPDKTLQASYRYQYVIEDIIDSESDVTIDISNDNSSEFSGNEISTDDFDINQLKLDNRNYYTNGELISPINTAGEASTYSYRSNYVSLILPRTSNNQLKSLTMKKLLETKDGVVNNSIYTWEIIRDGNFVNGSQGYVFNAAENEVIIDRTEHSFPNLFLGTAMPDGFMQLVGLSGYFYDNTDSSENSITFEYAYETLQGEVVTGTITLPVL